MTSFAADGAVAAGGAGYTARATTSAGMGDGALLSWFRRNGRVIDIVMVHNLNPVRRALSIDLLRAIAALVVLVGQVVRAGRVIVVDAHLADQAPAVVVSQRPRARQPQESEEPVRP